MNNYFKVCENVKITKTSTYKTQYIIIPKHSGVDCHAS